MTGIPRCRLEVCIYITSEVYWQIVSITMRKTSMVDHQLVPRKNSDMPNRIPISVRQLTGQDQKEGRAVRTEKRRPVVFGRSGP
jgi:hypothetical protein